jgi:hypothetical protein
MSNRPSIFLSDWESESNSKYKTTQELTKLIRGAKREAYPGIPQLDFPIIVEDDQGACTIDPDGMDWLELSLLIMNKAVTLPGITKMHLAELRIYIPDKQNMH